MRWARRNVVATGSAKRSAKRATAAHAESDQRLPPSSMIGRPAAARSFCRRIMSLAPGQISTGSKLGVAARRHGRGPPGGGAAGRGCAARAGCRGKSKRGRRGRARGGRRRGREKKAGGGGGVRGPGPPLGGPPAPPGVNGVGEGPRVG